MQRLRLYTRPEPTLVLPKSFSNSLPETARPLLSVLCSSLESLLGGCEVTCGRTTLGGWWVDSQYCTGGNSTSRAQCARLGLLTRWGRAFEGQELLLQEAETFGLLPFKASKSDRVQFIKRQRIIVSLQGSGNVGHSNPLHRGEKSLALRLRTAKKGPLSVED